MEITIKELNLVNFKGAKRRTEKFDHITTISGPNGSGKTTLVDAFMWLLFDKDSTGRKGFEIKTLDADNNPIHRLDHEVAGVIFVDGIRNDLKKTYKEKWVRPRGQEMDVLQGHETTYYWNDVPLKKGEYEGKVASLINEDLFILITNPEYFASLHWEKRRAMLVEMAGKVSSADVILQITTEDNKHRMNALLDVLASGKKTTEYKKEIAAKKTKIKAEIETIPARIDEAERSKPEIIDVAEANTALDIIKARIAEIDTILQSGSAAQQARRKAINDAATQLDNAQLKLRRLRNQIEQEWHTNANTDDAKIQSLQTQLIGLQSTRNQLEADAHAKLSHNARLQTSIDIARQAWKDENAKQFDRSTLDLNSTCPTCKQSLPEEDIEAQVARMQENFANDKAKKLQALNDEGKSLRSAVDNNEFARDNIQKKAEELLAKCAEIEAQTKELKDKPKETKTFQELLDGSAEYKQALADVEAANSAVNAAEAITTGEDNGAIMQEKNTLLQKQQDMVGTIAKQGEIQRINIRLDELDQSQRIMAQELADLEAAEYAVMQFEKAYMARVETRVNEMFTKVQFKMFELQINGGEAPACTTLINGVPWADANNAARINAGLDIINTVCRHYNVKAPIWIDNAESVTNLLPTDSQQIRLYVTANAEHQPAPVNTFKQTELFA